MTTPNVQNVEETNTQILSDIQNLQSFEQEMFSDLEENPSLTQQEQQAIIQKINQVSSMRLNLYKTLSGVTGYFQNSLYNSQGTLEEQVTAIDIVEQELNRAKQKLKILEEEKNNKIRSFKLFCNFKQEIIIAYICKNLHSHWNIILSIFNCSTWNRNSWNFCNICKNC